MFETVVNNYFVGRKLKMNLVFGVHVLKGLKTVDFIVYKWNKKLRWQKNALMIRYELDHNVFIILLSIQLIDFIQITSNGFLLYLASYFKDMVKLRQQPELADLIIIIIITMYCKSFMSKLYRQNLSNYLINDIEVAYRKAQLWLTN